MELRATETQARVWRMRGSRIAGHAASVARAVMQLGQTHINGRCRPIKSAMYNYTTGSYTTLASDSSHTCISLSPQLTR